MDNGGFEAYGGLMDAADILPRFATVDDFLAWEDRQEGRHEFDGVDVIPMTGGSGRHQMIVGNLFHIMRAIPACYCLLEMRVRMGNKIRYPDVSIVSDTVSLDAGTLTDALVVMEILSPDTMDNDLTVKVPEYFTLPSLRSYVVISQSERLVRTMQRGGDWTRTGANVELALPDQTVTVPLDEIYARVGL